MSQSRKTSIALSDDELAIVDATARRTGMSRNMVIRHLILQVGIHGAKFKTTESVLNLPPEHRDRLIGEIRQRAEAAEAGDATYEEGVTT